MATYTVIKSFNNNVVLASDEKTKEEVVLVGRGIGFNARPGISVDDAKIEKVFYFFDKDQFRHYETVINRIDKRVIGVAEEIIAMACKEFKTPLNEHIHVALADHINFTLERLAVGLEIKNPFLDEIKVLYPEDYELACRAARLIEERFGVEIPDGEKGFIAMHIHSAKSNREVSKTVKYASMINKMIEIIEEELGRKIERDGINYARLLVHLRFTLERIDKDIPIKNPLLANIKREFRGSYAIAKRLGNFIYERMGKKVPDDELGYLAVHIQRINLSLAGEQL
ncbi:transcriptional antiterminator, BglG family [Caldanaerovirga acetigignens]|uniref:Transcriptional antiterminator, BglG family n=1 Tax=Caldanaerovirga acetigignens TaxID=447595 RepID=A0A1M7IW03_9FIRM|nr:PRD domain-containing protein [Caldanaerovirga acetigignens]SHM44517.1 transcriptional antiterminator, BglG family [Caldanaerovirga acetigignens]